LKIVFGTDIGGMPWTDSMAPGIPPAWLGSVCRPWTPFAPPRRAPPKMLDMKGEIGALVPGAYADVIAVPGDPLKDVSALEHVRFVMHDGAIFKNELTKAP